MAEQKLLIIPGAQRAGTTTLFDALTCHSEIHALVHPQGGIRKEVEFFALNDATVVDNIEWYESLFGEQSGWYVDASTAYLMATETPSLVSQLTTGKVKYLVTLRDPIKRAYSGWKIMNRKDRPADPRSFEQIIDYIWKRRDSDTIAIAENQAIQNAVEDGLIDPDYLSNSKRPKYFPEAGKVQFQDPLWPFKYLQYSMYSQRLRSYWESRDDIMVICFEELILKPQRTLDRIYHFLGLEHQHSTIRHKNKGNRGTVVLQLWKRIGAWLRQIDNMQGILDSELVSSVKNVIRPSLSTRSYRKQLTERTLAQLKDLLQDEYAYWKSHRPEVFNYWINKDLMQKC